VDAVTRRSAIALLSALCATAVLADGPHYCGTNRWRSPIEEAAQRFDIPARWIRDVMRAESAGCVLLDGRPITSSAGAMGLMQLMPQTWQVQRERLDLGDDPHDPRDNILGGSAYLRELYDRYGVPGLFAAYHAGPGRYEEHLLHRRPLPPETIEYLDRMQKLSLAAGEEILPLHADEPVEDGLFVVVAAPRPSAEATEGYFVDARLLVTLRHGRDPSRRTSVADDVQLDVQD
jgi:hypothetical protein